MSTKIKPILNGSTETMLQSFYARAKYSKENSNKFYDGKAIEIVDKLDYDFTTADKDSTMSVGVIARTFVLDELVSNFIKDNPDCVVVNIACGLDTRVYRMDNGKLTWFNLDLPETIQVRDQLFNEKGRISTIGASVLDPSWSSKVTKRGKMLFIIEGLSMYFTKEENAKMLEIIHDNFDNAYVIMGCLSKKWVGNEKSEKSIQKTGAKFTFGADCFDDLKDCAIGYEKVKDDNIIRGMVRLYPFLKPFQNLSLVKKSAQKILVFKKIEG